MSLLNVNSSLGNNQLSNVCNAQDIITKMRCITFITPANSQLHRFSYFSAFKSFFFFFLIIECFQCSTLQLLCIQCQVLHTSLAKTQHNARPSPARVVSSAAVARQNVFGIQQIQTDSVATSYRKTPRNSRRLKKAKKEQPTSPNMTVHSWHRICKARGK